MNSSSYGLEFVTIHIWTLLFSGKFPSALWLSVWLPLWPAYGDHQRIRNKQNVHLLKHKTYKHSSKDDEDYNNNYILFSLEEICDTYVDKKTDLMAPNPLDLISLMYFPHMFASKSWD